MKKINEENKADLKLFKKVLYIISPVKKGIIDNHKYQFNKNLNKAKTKLKNYIDLYK